ncbi:S-methyl-5-thioadenosine phosphorylase [Pseudocyphellaria aurata]|nr:S-methyl-5-thioadenosine phosphorylase [Pseudocyphellaria aurata]
MDQLPTTYSDPIPIAVIGGTGLSSLPSPPFTPLATLPSISTPWGLTSSPIAVLSYTPPYSSSGSSPTDSKHESQPITIAFLARHGVHHQYAPHEVPFRANVAALRKLGVRCAVAFSAVGSLREEVKPRDFLVVDQLVDWTRGLRPRTFFEGGLVGHVSMADPFDKLLSGIVAKAVRTDGVLQGDGVKLHENGTVICIEGPQFSSRAESIFYRSPPLSCSVINMSAHPEAPLFREAEIAYALVCMSTDYDSWHATNEGVSVEMVMGHMVANAVNAKRAVSAVLGELSKAENHGVVNGETWQEQTKFAGGITKTEGRGEEALGKLRWLFEGYF